jgi:TolB-like protein
VVEQNNVSVQISVLRKLLGERAIATVPGVGYRIALEVRRGKASSVSARPAFSAADRPTIAVLPLKVLADDPRLSFLADGLAEDVIALLARVPGFELISHALSFAFRMRDSSLTDIARQLVATGCVGGRPGVRLVR